MTKCNLILLTKWNVVGLLLSLGIISCDVCNNPQHSIPHVSVDGDGPVYVEADGTFTLYISADSVEGAKQLIFQLLDGDSIVMENATGQFTSITPNIDGYDVRLIAQWTDTMITSPLFHVMGFIHQKPVQPIKRDELQKLINMRDVSLQRGEHPCISQQIELKVTGTERQVRTLNEVMQKLDVAWQRIIIDSLAYDETGHINVIYMHPEGEKPIPRSIDEGFSDTLDFSNLDFDFDE